MRTALGIDALIRQPQPLHRPPVDQVLLDNLSGILRLHMPVPNGLWIDNHRRAVLALVQAARLVDAHSASKACSFAQLLQLCV